MKFKNDIEVQAGIKDSSGSDGTLGQVLSSTVSGVSWITPPVGITGSGTTNFLPKWSSSTGLTNSIIFNNGNGVVIGATSTSANSGWRLNIHPDSTQAGLGIFCYNNNSLHGLRIEMNGTGDFIQARDVATQNDVFSVSYLGNTTANSFIKIGGTSSQYLMADGSVTTGPVLTGYVPYTGATQDVDLGIHQLKADSLAVSTTSTEAVDVGEIVWNQIDGTFDMGLIGGVTLQAGQEIHMYGKATEVISNGQAVMFAGVQGDHILIAKADAATINANPEYFIGIATQNFAINQFGYVTVFGNVRGLNTTAYTLGSVLYYDSTTASDGLLTATEPTAPNAKIEVAAVVRVHATQGILLVRPHVMPKLNDVQDVYAPTPSNKDGLWWSTANSRYENNSIAGILGYTPADDSQVVKLTGNQTINGVKTFNSSIITNSSLIITSGLYNILSNPSNTNYWQTYVDSSNVFNFGFGGTNVKASLSALGNFTANSFIKSGGTSLQYLMADGSVSTSVTARTETLFTATSGQTTFTINYTVGQLDVFYNGSKLNVSEFTATNGTSVVLGFACAAGESVVFVSYVNQVSGASGTANTVAKFTGAASLGDSQIIDNGTNVSIGYTTNPNTHKLDVNGSGKFSGSVSLGGGSNGLRLGNVGDNSAYDSVKFWYSGFNSGNPRVYLTPISTPGSGVTNTFFHLQNTNGSSNSSNNTMGLLVDGFVGVGTTTTPATNLQVMSAINTIPFHVSGLNQVNGIGIGTTTLNVAVIQGYTRTFSATNNISLQPDGGNVLISTTTDAGFKLDVNGTGRFATSLTVGAGSLSGRLSVRGTTNDSSAYSFEAANSSGNSLFLVRNDGNVGIGIVPQGRLDVNGTGIFGRQDYVFQATQRVLTLKADGINAVYLPSSYRIYTKPGALDSAQRLSIRAEYNGVESDDLFSVFGNGRVYAGFTSGANGTLCSASRVGEWALFLYDQVDNNAMISFRNSSLTQVGSVTITGGNTSTSYNTTSDYRLKEDLKEIKGLEKISKIKVYDFKWKSCDVRMDGVLAHELQEVLPYAVIGEKDGEDMQSVDYSKLVPLLVASIQELKAEIEILKNK